MFDTTATHLDHLLQHCAHDAHGGTQIYAVHGIPLIVGDSEHVGVAHDSSIIDQHVDPAAHLFGNLNEPFRRSVSSNIRRHGGNIAANSPYLLGSFLQTLSTYIG